jgi:AraC family transcriptional activator of pyochelin receptor
MQRRIDVKLNGNGSPSSEFGKCADPNAEVDIDDSTCNPTLCFENIRIRQGVRLMVANHTLRQRVHIAYEIDRAPISFSYTLSERIRCTMRHGLRTRRVAERLPGDGILAYLPQTTGTIDIFADRRVLGVSLHFSVTAFKDLYPWLPRDLQHLDVDPGGQSAIKPVYRQSRFGAETFHVLNQIITCPYTGDIRRIFYEAKALELVALKMAEFGQSKGKESSQLGRRDIDRIHEAYHILMTRIERPPCLFDLSRMVGLNRNKLNHGFKVLFGDTAFNLLRHARLSKARLLLRDSDLSLFEIALAVGYNSQANFITAFRKYYGKTPKTVRREENDEPAAQLFFG